MSKPRRLVTIRDPLSNRAATLRYGGRDTCPTPPAGYDTAPPADMLCQAAWWDGTTSNLFYKGGQLARMVDPGGATTDFGYNAGGRLETVRTPIQADAVAGGVAADNGTSRTTVTYDASGRVASVTLAGTAGAQPAHTYDFTQLANRDVKVHVAGLAEPLGFARRVFWEEDTNVRVVNGTSFARSQGAPTTRKVTNVDANGLPTASVYDWGNRAVSTTSAAGRRSAGQYDAFLGQSLTGRPTDAYGAGPSACFTEAGVPVSGCGTTTAHAQGGYDTTWNAQTSQREAMVGLAAAWWANTTLSRQPVAHTREDVRPSLIPPTLPAGVPAAFSARYTGELTIPAGTRSVSLRLTGYGRLFVDDTLVVEAWSPHASPVTVPGVSVTNAVSARHRVRVDYASQSGVAPLVEVWWTPSGGGAVTVPASSFAPRYSALASTKAMDTTKDVAMRTTELTPRSGHQQTPFRCR